MLQADSEKLRQAWIQAVQASIASAYRESPDSCYIEVSRTGNQKAVGQVQDSHSQIRRRHALQKSSQKLERRYEASFLFQNDGRHLHPVGFRDYP